MKKSSATGAILLLFILGNSGCAWIKKDAKEVGNVVLHCLGQEVKDKTGDLIPVLVAAAGNSMLEQVVESLIEHFGLDIAGCAVLASRDQVATSANATAGASLTGNANVQKVTRLNTVIASKRWIPGV